MDINDPNPKPQDIELSGLSLRVWTGGKGPAILLLHSAWGDAEMSWGPVWQSLCRSFTVIAPDMPGFGASGELPEPALRANAHVLRDLLVFKSVETAVVAGNSFGAAVALEFAGIFPERTRHLVLVNGGAMPVMPGWIKKIMQPELLEKGFRKLMRSVSYSDKAFARAFPNQSKLPPGFIGRIRRNEAKQSEIVYRTFMNQAGAQKFPAVPVTVVWGTGDRLLSMRQAGVTGEKAKAQTFFIEGAGHMPQLEAPEQFVEALKKIAALT